MRRALIILLDTIIVLAGLTGCAAITLALQRASLTWLWPLINSFLGSR